MCKSFPRRLFSWLPDALSLVPVYSLYRCSVAGVLHATDGPTPAFSGAAGDLHRPARALARHDAKRSRPDQGPRQRRPLQSTVGPQDGDLYGISEESCYFLLSTKDREVSKTRNETLSRSCIRVNENLYVVRDTKNIVTLNGNPVISISAIVEIKNTLPSLYP